MSKNTRVFETVLYAPNLNETVAFYEQILELKLLSKSELMAVFGLDQHYLLIFNPELSGRPNRPVPSHAAVGNGHVAFTAPSIERERLRERLVAAGVDIEHEADWGESRGGQSLYFRDPAGNSIEFAPPELWDYLRS